MKFRLITVGKVQLPFIKAGFDNFAGRIQPMSNFELIELPDIKKRKKPDIHQIKKSEGKKILSAISSQDFIILLDENGRHYSSRQFAKLLQDKMLLSIKSLTFIIGGPYGFSDTVYQRANHQLSLSKMTFPHDLVRLIFMEQLYRGLSIINNLPYHHD